MKIVHRGHLSSN